MKKVFDGKTSVISTPNKDGGVCVVYNNTDTKAYIHHSFEVCIYEDRNNGRLRVTIHQRGVNEPLLSVDPLELAFASKKHAQSLIEEMDYQLRGVLHE